MSEDCKKKKNDAYNDDTVATDYTYRHTNMNI